MPWTILLLTAMVAGATVALGAFSPGSAPGKDIVEGRVKENAPTATPTPVPTNLGIARGRLTFEDILVNVDVTGTATEIKTNVLPIRFTEVVALDASGTTVISPVSAVTDQNGEFALQVPLDTPFFPTLVSRTTPSGRANLEVRTFAGALYMVTFSQGGAGAPTIIGASNPDVRFEFSTLAVLDPVTGAFNILDAAVRGSDRVNSITGVIPSLVTFFWERTERQGTFFTSTGGPSGGPAITINGGDLVNDDTNEYDDGVILHEYGHFIAFAFSRDSSLGGPHGLGDVTNPPLAYSEGFASFFFGLADRTPFLTDTAALAGSPLVGVINLEGGRGTDPTVPRGIRSESSVYEVMWDLIDGVESRQDLDGDNVAITEAAFFAPFVALRSTNRYLTINDLLEFLVATGTVTSTDLVTLLAAPENQRISFPATGNDIVPVRPPGPDLAFTTNVTVTTRAQADGKRFTLDESNMFIQFDLTRQASITPRLALDPGFTGQNAQGHNIDLVILTAENALATDIAGNVITPVSPSPEVTEEVRPAVVAPGRYIFWIHGRPDITTSLTNATTVQVTGDLSVTITF